MAKKKKTRDEARSPKTERDLNRLMAIYRILERRQKSPFPRTEDIGDEKEMEPIIVHKLRGSRSVEK